MKFRKANNDRSWITRVKFRGRTVKVRIDESVGSTELERVVKVAAQRIRKQWSQIEQHLLDALLETYNDVWSDPEGGHPELAPTVFLQRLSLQTIFLESEEQTSTLYFEDGDLFGGHLMELFWTDETMYPATLVG